MSVGGPGDGCSLKTVMQVKVKRQVHMTPPSRCLVSNRHWFLDRVIAVTLIVCKWHRGWFQIFSKDLAIQSFGFSLQTRKGILQMGESSFGMIQCSAAQVAVAILSEQEQMPPFTTLNTTFNNCNCIHKDGWMDNFGLKTRDWDWDEDDFKMRLVFMQLSPESFEEDVDHFVKFQTT